MANPEKSYQRGQVVQIIQSVIEKMDKGSASEQQLDVLRAEITELANTISKLKQDISDTLPHDMPDEKIPGATDELDAVVEHTAEATDIIMTACETMENMAEKEGQVNADLAIKEITKIYEACGFQDITGQRITKVIKTLKEIDYKVSTILTALDMQVGPFQTDSDASFVMPASNQDQEPKQTAKKHKPSTGLQNHVVSIEDKDSLLNGPQMTDNAVKQDDIDKLLAEFDV